jgi:hypothetical protein
MIWQRLFTTDHPFQDAEPGPAAAAPRAFAMACQTRPGVAGMSI